MIRHNWGNTETVVEWLGHSLPLAGYNVERVPQEELLQKEDVFIWQRFVA